MIANQRGMTVVEVLVAAAIIAIGLVGVMTVVPISSYSVYEGGHLSTATFLAQQKMEELRNVNWQEKPLPGNDCLGISAGGGMAAPTSNACTRTLPTACNAGTTCSISPDEPNITNYGGYSRTVRIVSCAALPGGCGGVVNANLRRITVTVRYRPLTGSGTSGTGTTKPVVLVMDAARR